MSSGPLFSTAGCVSTNLKAVLALIGFTATLAQIVLLRELMVFSYGNEISVGVMLSSWLLWTALGSGMLGRIGARASRPAIVMAVLQVLLALLLPATIFAVRAARNVLHAYPGELLGPVPIFLVCVVSLSCFCAVCGWAFVASATPKKLLPT